MVPTVIALVGLAVGSLFSWYFLHKQQIKEMAEVGLLSGLGANIIWLLGVLLVSAFRAPWLLDAESGELINAQEQRAQIAENSLAEIQAAKKKHEEFAVLMQQGVNFSSQLAECRTNAHFVSWDFHFSNWTASVQKAMRDMGFSTNAVEFIRAGEKAEPIKGIMSTRNEQEQRCRILEQHQDYLADYVEHRLS